MNPQICVISHPSIVQIAGVERNCRGPRCVEPLDGEQPPYAVVRHKTWVGVIGVLSTSPVFVKTARPLQSLQIGENLVIRPDSGPIEANRPYRGELNRHSMNMSHLDNSYIGMKKGQCTRAFKGWLMDTNHGCLGL